MAMHQEKYVVVLAHADGWGASSANHIVRGIRKQYPEMGIYLVVSQATKNSEGKIATKLGDLVIPRALKETCLLKYFERIDNFYASMPPREEIERQIRQVYQVTANEILPHLSPEERAEHLMHLGMWSVYQDIAEFYTFKELAKRYCTDGEVYYTMRGGTKGGEEAAVLITEIEKQHGHGPEVLLSVDTMALLPGELLDKYQCFSTHPGPREPVII